MRPLGGKPMAAWTLDAAQASAFIDHIVVSTDDTDLAALARARGLSVVVRPPALAGSEASVIDAIAHALASIEKVWSYVVLLQPTSPLRLAADIDTALRLCHDNAAPAVFSVSPLPKPGGFYGFLADDGFQPLQAHGDPVILNGAVYVGRPERLFEDRSFQPEGARPFLMPLSRGIDVDTLLDFSLCEALIPLVQAGRAAELDVVRR